MPSFINKLQQSIPIQLGWVLLACMAMYLPTYWHAFNTLWTNENQSHGPIVLFIVIYLIWQKKHEVLLAIPQSHPKAKLGSAIFIFGAFFYFIGRSQDILILDLGSQVPLLIGLILILYGPSVLKLVWFPIFFLFFLLPIPEVVLSNITLPMKIAVSVVADNLLYLLGYPVAREGVIIQVAQYQLMVADACAGMHTLISLEAMGLLYLNLVKHNSMARNFILAILIIPISFSANVMRVIFLILITYYLGDEVGQGFVHKFAGLLLFIVALSLILFVDTILQSFIEKSKKPSLEGL